MSSTEDSGVYNTRRPREQRDEREPRARVAVPVTWSVGVTLAGAFITWGAMSQRTQDMERRLDSMSIDVRQVQTEVAGHDTKIEVDRTQYAEILRRLNDLNEKIERAK